ncbi:RCC1 domain-containing protein [Dyella flagellata]|nr:hypothetical protein [Dyella flagellata]
MLAVAACAAHALPRDSDNISQLVFSYKHRCALRNNGSVDCVSESPYLGESRGGDGEITYRPVQMVPRGATRLTAGEFAICAIVDDALDCWKDVPATGKKLAPPQQIIASHVTDIAVGDDHACAVANGAALCWGSDSAGKVGHHEDDYHNGTVQTKPWPVIASGVTRVAAGGDVSCAVAQAALWCWGYTGLASDANSKALWDGDHPPLRVFERGVTTVAAGSHHVCAIVSGTLWCWGDNTHGQVGIGISVDHAQHSPSFQTAGVAGTFMDGDQTCHRQWTQLTCTVEHPVKVIDHGVTAVFASANETCAQANGSLQCWGANWQGQLGIAPAKKDVLKATVAIAGEVNFVALDSTRVCAVMQGGVLSCTLPCKKDVNTCPDHPGFVADDPNDMSGVEMRGGVWRGTIGNAEVMVCLQAEQPFSQSSYYYLRHGFSIPLDFADNSGAILNEASSNGREFDYSKPTAVWTLQPAAGRRMDGIWKTADGSRTLPIHLVRVMSLDTGNGASCDSTVPNDPSRLAFNAPRVASQKLSITQMPGGLRRIGALDGHVSMTELPASVPNADNFNHAMRAWLAEEIAGYYDCALSNGGSADFNESYDISFLSPPWLVARESYSVYCGGAHPSGGTAGYSIWNLETGKTVDPWDFLKDSKWDYVKEVDHCDNANNCSRRPPPKLNEILTARFNEDNAGTGDCSDSLDSGISPGYLLHMDKNGLIFSTDFPHVIQACDEDIALPWKTVAPFLTPLGKTVMQSLTHKAPQHGH